jgi:hypothetical protein
MADAARIVTNSICPTTYLLASLHFLNSEDDCAHNCMTTLRPNYLQPLCLLSLGIPNLLLLFLLSLAQQQKAITVDEVWGCMLRL